MGVDAGSWASSPAVRRSMKANRRTDTNPERRLRALLHARGLRFRKDHRIRVGEFSVRADIVFVRAKVAVFVDGCFWHSCPTHATVPKTNRAFWVDKLGRTVERDRAVDARLSAEGWVVVHVWEHERAEDASARIESELAEIALGTGNRPNPERLQL